MESKEKVVAALAGIAALGAVGYMAYKWGGSGKGAKKGSPKTASKQKQIETKEEEDDTPNPNYEKAVKLKDEGNNAFKVGKYKEAVRLYTEAMELSTKDIHFLLSNRSAAYLAMGDNEHAQKDAEACIGVKADWPKGYFRLGKVYYAKKDIKQAFVNYYRGFLLDPKSEELKKSLETVSPELRYQFGELDSRSLVDNFLVKLYFEQQTTAAIETAFAITPATFKAVITEYLKDADAQPETLLSNELVKACIAKSEADTYLIISQLILFEHNNPEASSYFAKKAFDLQPENSRVLLNYASTLLRQKNQEMGSGDLAFDCIQKAFALTPDDVLLTHTYAFLVLKKAQIPARTSSNEIRQVLKDMKYALQNPKTNHMLVADSGLRLWFKLFEDDEIQAQLIAEEEHNQRQGVAPHKAYLNGLLKGAFNKLCLEPFFVTCLSSVVLTNPGLEKVLSPFRTSFLFELKSVEDFNALQDLVFALALQHFRNNHAIPPTEEEKEKLKEVLVAIEEMVKDDKALVDGKLSAEFTKLLGIVALYEPLDQTPAASVLSELKDLTSLHPTLATLVKKSVVDHDVEEGMMDSLARIGTLPEQPYIQHLQERLFSFWDSAGIMAGKVTRTTFARELKVLFPKNDIVTKLSEGKKLSVLVACCGSGLEAFQLTSVYENIDIYAFDPSEVHIAYAQRQNKELGNSNAKFFVADLMSVKPSDFGVSGFDLVIGSNILHNFPNPAQAFAKLTTFLNPGGVLKASVFSRSAIMQIAEVRRFLNGKFKKPFFDDSEFPRLIKKPSVDQVRESRWLISDVEEQNPIAEFVMSPTCQFFNDFTDVVFHPSIVGFSFETVCALLKKNHLELIGFEYPGISQEAILKYQTEHPDDLLLKNGKYLDQYDAKNKDELCPLTFSPHLSFFAFKPDEL